MCLALHLHSIIFHDTFLFDYSALLKTFDVNFVLISKELIRETEPASSYGWVIDATHIVEQALKKYGFLIYSGKDYDVYCLEVNYAQPTSITYYKEEGTYLDPTEIFLKDLSLFYRNNTHVILPNTAQDVNIMKNNEAQLEYSKFLAGSIAVIKISISDANKNKTLAIHVGDVYNPSFLNIAFYKSGVSVLSSFPALSGASIILVPTKNNDITVLRMYIPSLAWAVALSLNLLYLFLSAYYCFKYCS